MLLNDLEDAPSTERLKGRVLLVEDNLVNQMVGIAMLDFFGAGEGRDTVTAAERLAYPGAVFARDVIPILGGGVNLQALFAPAQTAR